MRILLRCTGENWPFYFHFISYAAFPAESMKIILDCRKENAGNPSNRQRIKKNPSPAALSISFFITAYITWCIQGVYTGCHRRNGPNFGRVFLMLNYTDKTQNSYIQIWTVTEIMAREFLNFDSCYTLTDCQIHIETGRNIWFL